MQVAPAQRYLRAARRLLGLVAASVFLAMALSAFAALPGSAHAVSAGSCEEMAAAACLEACRPGSPAAAHSAQSSEPAGEGAAALRSAPFSSHFKPAALPVARVARYGPPAYLEFRSLLL